MTFLGVVDNDIVGGGLVLKAVIVVLGGSVFGRVVVKTDSKSNRNDCICADCGLEQCTPPPPV